MAEKLKEGDVVQLKSGGPTMTISGIRDERAYCVFFDKSGAFQNVDMSTASLIKFEDKPEAQKLPSFEID